MVDEDKAKHSLGPINHKTKQQTKRQKDNAKCNIKQEPSTNNNEHKNILANDIILRIRISTCHLAALYDRSAY